MMSLIETDIEQFQSRSGFSECFDATSAIAVTSSFARFNPVLGFLSASTFVPYRVVAVQTSFNPVLGFLSASTLRALRSLGRRIEFQSRSGFSECFDSWDHDRAGTDGAVSIPFWVF